MIRERSNTIKTCIHIGDTRHAYLCSMACLASGRCSGKFASSICRCRGIILIGDLYPTKHSDAIGHDVNLPGWCWAEIQQLALVGSSSSLHSEACNALGASDGVIHSSISHEVDGLRASANQSKLRSKSDALVKGSGFKRLVDVEWVG